MEPLTALAVGGAIAGGLGSFFGTQDANKQNIRLWREQRDWQTQMSNTAYQRAMLDMRAAGLNPVLAYSQGGASSPTSSGVTVDSPLASSVGSAVQAMRQAAEIKQLEEQNKQTKSQTALNDAARATEIERKKLTANSAVKAAADADKARADAAKARAEVPAAENKGAVEATVFGKAKAWIDSFLNTANSAKPLGSAAKNLARSVAAKRRYGTYKYNRKTGEVYRS